MCLPGHSVSEGASVYESSGANSVAHKVSLSQKKDMAVSNLWVKDTDHIILDICHVYWDNTREAIRLSFTKVSWEYSISFKYSDYWLLPN